MRQGLGDMKNMCIGRALLLADELMSLADAGEAQSEDDGCAVLYGVIRDCGYAIRERARKERKLHELLGIWDDGFESKVRRT